MQVAGIDLAWGSRARTGVALTDEHGALLRSASVTSDEEIADFFLGSTLSVVAIDAPIIVTNPTGMRECERDLSKDFRRFHAGAHPTNMNQPSMQPEPRAGRLAVAHGWNADLESVPHARAPIVLEVYPHSSMVGLFGLDRILAYKAKSGRTPQMRKSQFSRLVTLMEANCDHSLRLLGNPRWQQLVYSASTATRQSDLNVIEDEIDAIFCAYVAWIYAMSPDSLVKYGSAATGVIVTFPPPSFAGTTS